MIEISNSLKRKKSIVFEHKRKTIQDIDIQSFIHIEAKSMRSHFTEFYSNDFITIVSNVFFNSIKMVVCTYTAVHMTCLYVFIIYSRKKLYIHDTIFFIPFGIEILLSSTSCGSVSILLVLKIYKLLVFVVLLLFLVNNWLTSSFDLSQWSIQIGAMFNTVKKRTKTSVVLVPVRTVLLGASPSFWTHQYGAIFSTAIPLSTKRLEWISIRDLTCCQSVDGSVHKRSANVLSRGHQASNDRFVHTKLRFYLPKIAIDISRQRM